MRKLCALPKPNQTPPTPKKKKKKKKNICAVSIYCTVGLRTCCILLFSECRGQQTAFYFTTELKLNLAWGNHAILFIYLFILSYLIFYLSCTFRSCLGHRKKKKVSWLHGTARVVIHARNARIHGASFCRVSPLVACLTQPSTTPAATNQGHTATVRIRHRARIQHRFSNHDNLYTRTDDPSWRLRQPSRLRPPPHRPGHRRRLQHST
jgi:hypothetical protein